MSVEYFAFPDRRESVGGGAPLTGEMPGDGDDFLDAMRQHRWRHPVILVYREHHHFRWSYLTLMPSGAAVDDTPA